MKPRPEDGSLGKITSSCLNPEFNAIIIQRTDEFEESDGATYAFATLDRTREGVEWPGDQILEKLIPELPKVKTVEMNKPDVMTKTNSLQRHHTERKLFPKPLQKNNYCSTTHRPKPPQRRFRPERSENPSSFNEIDPWVRKPWENQTLFPQIKTTASASATSLITTAPFNNFYDPTCASSLPLPPRTSNNNFNVPNNNNNYEKNVISNSGVNIPFINNHSGLLNMPPPTNRMPIGPRSSLPLPNKFSQHPNRGFCGPVRNMDFNVPNRNTGLFGESPAVRYQGKHGLLGDSPFANTPFNSNLVMFSNNMSAQSNPEGNTATLIPRDEENIGDKNSSSKNNSLLGSYDTAQGRIPISNFNHLSGQESHDSYEYPNDSRTNSFRGTCEKNYNRYHKSGSYINHFEDQYNNNYDQLDRNHRKSNKNVISSKTSRNSSKTNYGKFQKPSAGVNRSKSDFKEIDNSTCENTYKGSQISNTSQTSPIMNNWNRNQNNDSLIHISDSAVIYNPEDFQNDSYSTAVTNTSVSSSNLHSVSRPNIRRNFRGKNIRGAKRQWPGKKYAYNNYYRQNRVDYNQGQQRYKKRRTLQE